MLQEERAAPSLAAARISSYVCCCYLVLLPEPLLLPAPVLGVDGELLLGDAGLGEELLGEDEAPPDEELPGEDEAPPDDELPLDLKYVSHSVRDTCPSLFVSTAEKLGALLEAPPLEALPPLDELLLSVALGALSVLPEAPLEDPELCANEALEIANKAAAVAVPTSFNNIRYLLGKVKG